MASGKGRSGTCRCGEEAAKHLIEAGLDLSKKAYKEGKTIREVAREETDLYEDDLNRLLDEKQMTGR